MRIIKEKEKKGEGITCIQITILNPIAMPPPIDQGRKKKKKKKKKKSEVN